MGILDQIAQPQLADISGALDIRQKRLDADENKRKEIRMGQLIAEAIPNLKPGSTLEKMAKEDPKNFMLVTKAFGIPLNAGDQAQQLVDDVDSLYNAAQNDPKDAYDHAVRLKAQRNNQGVDTPQLDKFLSGMEDDPQKAMTGLFVTHRSLNHDKFRKEDMEDRKLDQEDRSLDIQEKRATTMTPFEQAQAKHWNDTAATDQGGLSDDAIELAATRLLNGEQASKVLANMGRGAQGAADIRAVQNRLAEKAKDSNVDATKILQNTQNVTADNRTFTELGAREGKIATAVQESKNFAKIALDASNKVPRDKFVPWNKLKNYSESQLSDPNLAAFKAANTSLINAYARAVGGGTVTVHGQEEGEKMLNTATSPEAYNAVVQQILTETQAALDSPKQVREHMHNGGSGSHDTPKKSKYTIEVIQ
jgi:hypothetical protein